MNALTGQGLIDGIYEAAFIPELWPEVLASVALASGGVSGEIQSIDGRATPKWRATPVTEDALHKFMSGGQWQSCERPVELLARDYPGFLCDADYLSADQMERDPVREILSALGLGWQLGTIIPMPSGEIVAFTFERQLEAGRPGQADVQILDDLRPHLARAGLLAARLGLERARTMVETLEAVGLAAAVLSHTGRAIMVNHKLEMLNETILPAAHGKLRIADRKADALLSQAIADLPLNRNAGPQSIPARLDEERQTIVLHLVPLRGNVYDIFSGATALLVATPIGLAENVPGASILKALFDLSPNESRLAASLASGRSLKQSATEQNIAFSTARSQLEGIFRKTGTHQQSQLVALLKTVPPISA